MLVLHVDHASVLGGAERSVAELVASHRAMGLDARVAVGQPGPFSAELERRGLPWIDLGWASGFVDAPAASGIGRLLRGFGDYLRAVRRLRRIIRARRPGVVQAHTRKSQLVASAAVLGLDVRLVWHLRDDFPSRRALAILIRLAMRRADHAVALAPWMVERYARARALPRSRRIGVVPSGIDTSELGSLPTPWLDGQREPVIGYVGQVAAWKGPHLLVEAAELMADLPGPSFRLVGDVTFPAAEAAYGADLRDRIAASPVAARIQWNGAAPDPAAALAEIDILVHTSVTPEPFGRVLVEALAARRPIVCFKSGGPADLLDETVAVFATRVSAPALAAAVRAVVADRDAARRRADAGVRLVDAYSPDAAARAMLREYEGLL